ncbi:hypothetical protein N7489_011817 [Penicillium chrysogenum]|uniref:RNase III domain-containing protein n=1 Tax=Penicillium chrysogenum TaxID=5076 RepID=A0ABQ8W0J5_PENCH|nr:uncharacterized protein N7489_011817 [Penicillium chrysogenum]KAJ5231109.1 hypothetical protein N7489_011817 [Penicillium chrysogenum]KAJ5253435.1 hypothetical protein N7505_012098 [Penicillium chrysogenum]KAJ5268494.1 hypothetical protein N7524_005953 [Penicillium chrysogenum]KAJ6162746.1 hypothetical protein N7497_002725 [Penicillium chrysogenum]
MVGRYLLPLPSDDEIEVLEKKIQYRFVDRELLREALQASTDRNQDGNKTLAFFGDLVLDLVLAISGRKENKPRGKIKEMSEQKAGNVHLSKQGFDLGIDKFIVKNPSQTVVGINVMATTMEAIVGAVYLDCNKQIAPCADVMVALGLSWPE